MSTEPVVYFREVHEGWLEFNKVDIFSDGQGGGEKLYAAPPADREMLKTILAELDFSVFNCPVCGHGAETKTFDITYMLRDYLAE